MTQLISFLKARHGATAIEYALLAGMIAIAIAAVVGLLGQDLTAAYQRVTNMFT